MFSKINHTVLLIIYFLLSAFSSKAGSAQLTDADLKQIISRISSDMTFRNSLQIRSPALLEEFYVKNQYHAQWFGSVSDIAKRSLFTILISAPEKYMLENNGYHFPDIISKEKIKTRTDSLYTEIKFSDAALSFLTDIAYGENSMVRYNGWQYNSDCIVITSILQQALNENNFEKYIQEVEPENIQYRKLRSVYEKLYLVSVEKGFQEITVDSNSVSVTNKNLVKKLQQLGYLDSSDATILQLYSALSRFQTTHNILPQNILNTATHKILNEPIRQLLKELRWDVRWFRWLSCIQNKSYIIVNIAANRLSFFECNAETLVSRVVVGKISTKTSTLTSIIKNVIYYPYWNVPFDIATKEMLPALKRNPAYLDKLKIEVIRGSHTYASSTDINWHRYSSHNFPFSFRQLPGCHNSLGLLKFDFENPFHTYLHDTNNKLAFISKKRFFSHGCIRIENPYELALDLGIPAEKINMDSCLSGMIPEVIPLNIPMPIFVIYATVDVIDGELYWFEDVYQKIKK